MKKIFYNIDGWVCERYPYDIPIDNQDRFIEVNEETYQKTFSSETYKAWRVVNDKLEIQKYEETPTQELYIQELEEIQNWFLSTDYIPNKVIVGEWEQTDIRFIEYKQERAVKRARQDELKSLLL